ncbi:ribonuclease HII [Bacillus solimangrovi]|uniref:Ribonuclease HII n=1 Tax=Bacillus solimangrovi TaxID=1305675 RepID=A0A1E5LAX5_9BACI|nr:ribonuclease HII [Bacillus solimangrovi]OEH91244.1 ribonuclease HII [Bacillus solimangrovi]
MQKLTIKEIEEKLFSNELSSLEIQKLYKDERKGVQRLLNKKERLEEEEHLLKQQYESMSMYENQCRSLNYKWIAGIDEVGRGPLAGPVTAAAVILSEDAYIAGLNDSKTLSEAKRETLYEEIMKSAISVSVQMVDASKIDEINIYQAAKHAMKQAVETLDVKPDYLLVDAMEIALPIPQRSIIKGDANSVSIAAASIVAKVTRDRYMKELGVKYPEYGFENHMGYGTKQHLEAIEKIGVINEHRRTFSPVQKFVE